MSEEAEVRSLPEDRLRGWLKRPGVAVVGVILLAGFLRLWALGHPAERVFDEVYYPKSACWLLGWSNERCGNDEGAFYDARHPPLGKYTIALGELALGFDASDGLSERDTLSIRLPSAIAGTLAVGLIALAAYLLFGSVGAAWLAGALLAFEGLSVVHSRVGMLDIFVTLWILAGFVGLLLDRRWVELHAGDERRRRIGRPWRLATGVAFGAAFATKWSGLMGLAAVAAIGLWWDLDRSRSTGEPGWFARTLRSEVPGILGALVVVPIVIYIASYTAYFVTPGASVGAFVEGQLSNARFHATFVADDEACGSGTAAAATSVAPSGSSCEDDITSRPLDWLLLRSPIVYWEDPTPGHRAMILANGNAGVFWGALATIPLAVYLAVRRRDRTAAVIAAMALMLYLPWFLVQRIQYFFYAVPIVPFLVLGFVLLVRHLRRAGWDALGNGLAIYAMLLGVVLWPVYAGIPLSDVAWRALQPLFPLWWGGL